MMQPRDLTQSADTSLPFALDYATTVSYTHLDVYKRQAEFATSVRGAFDEDRAVLTAVHKGMANKRTPNLDLKIDVGPMRFRRNLAKLIEAEQAQKVAAK